MLKKIDIDKLESPKPNGKGITARCPACAEQNSDKRKHNHLSILEDGRFNCVVDDSTEHRNRILELVGIESNIAPVIVITKPEKITVEKIFNKSCLDRLLPHYAYWEKRGISKDTVKKLKGGWATSGEFNGYYVFPIFNEKDEIIGFTGRNTLNNDKIKWRHHGRKTSWIFPQHFNKSIIKQNREVILVESVGNLLTLMECGIDNVMVLFGTVISPKLVNYLVSLNVNRIIISLDVDENQAGQNGAQKTLDKLSKYFDDKNLIVAPITGANDFNELLTKCGKEAIINWYESIPQT